MVAPMRTPTPRLDMRWTTIGRSKMAHDGTVLQAIGCVAAAALLYLMFALLCGVDDDDDAFGALQHDLAAPVVAIVSRA
jgi:hypothetical protein